MTLAEIAQTYSGLEISEQRRNSDKYQELVFFSKDTEQWNKALAQKLGPPVKPAGEPPSPQQQESTKDYGGIFDNQTLFEKKFDQLTVLAMFWPWQDGQHTTLKIALLA